MTLSQFYVVSFEVVPQLYIHVYVSRCVSVCVSRCVSVCVSLQLFNSVSKLLYWLTRRSRFLAGSILKFISSAVIT